MPHQERFSRIERADRVELEFHAGSVVRWEKSSPRQRLRRAQAVESFVPFQAAPVILSVRGQKNVSEPQSCFGQVPSHKVGFVWTELPAGQEFGAEKQSGASIHQQPRRLT